MNEFDTVEAEVQPEFQAPEAAEAEKGFPSCRYGPDGQSAVFQSKDEVPAGWVDHPSKVKGAPDPRLWVAERRRSRAEIAKELKGLEIAFNPAFSAKQLEALLPSQEGGDSEVAGTFDHDGDGAPGGSLPKAKRAKRKVTRNGTRK